MSMDLYGPRHSICVGDGKRRGYDHERWEAKPLQYYLKYCEWVYLSLALYESRGSGPRLGLCDSSQGSGIIAGINKTPGSG